MTSGLETESAYSGFGTSQICHLLTYLLRHLPTYLQTWNHTRQATSEVTGMIVTTVAQGSVAL